MKAILCSLILFLAPASAWSCINKAGTKYGGGSGDPRSFDFGWMSLQNSLKMNLPPEGAQMEANLRGATNFNDRNDYAVALMYLGRNQETVALLKRLEEEQPGEYFVAANLGTAYELSGNNEEALQWITEGIKRNPKSHEGTEWLHARILDAKIARQKDPVFFEKHSVLELEPGKIGASITVGKLTMAAKDLADAIVHQLGERLQFVKPPDPAVASLLYDYAAIEAATQSMESARHILKMATDYGYPPAKANALDRELDHRLARARLIRNVGIGCRYWSESPR
jgi:tetratricopeptide (TPR) repeat protein